MTVLNPDNQPTSLRVDEEGRLLVAGTGGGGGTDLGEVQDYLDGNGYEVGATTQAAAVATANAYTDDQVNGVYAAMPLPAEISRTQFDDAIADPLLSNYVWAVGFEAPGTITVDPTVLTDNFTCELAVGQFGVTLTPAGDGLLNGSTDPITLRNTVARLVRRRFQDDYVLSVDGNNARAKTQEFGSGHALNPADDGTIIETGSELTLDTGLPTGFSCVVLVEDSGSVTVSAEAGTKINGVDGATVTRAFADNKVFGIVQRPSDATDYLVTGV